MQLSIGGSRFDCNVLDIACAPVKSNDRYRSAREISVAIRHSFCVMRIPRGGLKRSRRISAMALFCLLFSPVFISLAMRVLATKCNVGNAGDVGNADEFLNIGKFKWL